MTANEQVKGSLVGVATRAGMILALTIVALVVGLALGAAVMRAGPQGKEASAKAKVELPAAVAQAVKENRPNAEIDKVTVEKEAGITLYDFEFKGDAGEMDVAEDGTVLDVSTVVQMKDLPWAAASAIRKAAEGATIKRLEKSEVRAEIKEEGGKGTVVRLTTPRYVYEAEMEKGDQAGEVEVTADGKLVEPMKWWKKGEKEK